GAADRASGRAARAGRAHHPHPTWPRRVAGRRQPGGPPVTGAALRAIEVSRVHGSGPSAVHGCRNVNLAVSAGELLAITGPSGAGKTTLLNLLGGLDRPTTGQVILDSADLAAMSERQLVYLRRNRIGYLFDSPGLIPILSAAENVEAPLRLLYVW